MRQVYLITLACAALVAGSTMASAQGFRDDPPGWAFQKRGIIEMNGGDPLNQGRYSGSYGWRGDYAWAYRHHRHYRHYRHHRHWR
jgi:hypothetical protein